MRSGVAVRISDQAVVGMALHQLSFTQRRQAQAQERVDSDLRIIRPPPTTRSV